MSYPFLGAQVWHVLTRNHTVLPPVNHTFIHKWTEPYVFTSQPPIVTALFPVLISVPLRVEG